MNFSRRPKQRLNRKALYSTAAFWDQKAETYSQSAISMWRNAHINECYRRQQIEIIDTWLTDVRGARILDVGCGTGRVSRHLTARGAEVLGIDFSTKAIDVAVKLTNDPKVSYRQQSVFDIGEREEFDAVTCIGVLAVACENDAQLNRVLGTLLKALKPGGRLIFIEPLHCGFLRRVLNMSLSRFLVHLEIVGLHVESIHQIAFWPVRLALCEIAWPRSVVKIAFSLGEALIRVVGNKGGDYKAVLATFPKSTNNRTAIN
jgi:2-polyprenyl-3-methyl-5-hydroxy-6-metoxy-1,4-benzoquinol methylase